MRNKTLAFCAVSLLMISPAAKSQGFGAREDGVSYTGTNLTYYPAPTFEKCQTDCANNGNCKGFSWIQAGTYTPRDPAMCYLVSAITGRTAARGHYSAVKIAGGGGTPTPVVGANGFTAEDGTNRHGSDYKSFDLAQPNYALCRDACVGDANCRAYTYLKPGAQGQANGRCFLKSEIPPAQPNACCISGFNSQRGISAGGGMSADDNTNRYGSDYKNFDLSVPNYTLCRDACANDPTCKAYTFVKQGVQGSAARCWLKSAVPPSRPESCCISGIKQGATTGSGGPPPPTTGNCSAVGKWKQSTPDVGDSDWDIRSDGQATEQHSNMVAPWTFSGRTIRINWTAASGYAGVYEWTLDGSCISGSGWLTFTKGGTGTHKSNLKRMSGG